jgi:hypothetical protein
MSYAPIQLISVPIENYDGWWLKFYAQGTTTPLSMATDSTGGTLIVKAEISSGGTVPAGFLKTSGNALLNPHMNAAYDAWLFPTAAEADANDTTNAIQLADNITADPASSVTIPGYTVTDKAAAVLIAPVAGKTMFVESSDGGLFKAVTGAAPGTYSDNGGAYCGTVFIHTGGDGSTAWEREDEGNIKANWFGASPLAVGSVNTSAFQAAIDYVNSIGGGVIDYYGEHLIAGSGSSISGREYGLLLKSNVTLNGNGMYTSSLKVTDSSDIDLINTDRSASQSSIGITNTTLDGNEANQGATPSNGFSAWLFDIDGLVLRNIYSLNPASWGIRPEKCNHVVIENIRCNHSAESNSDGIHFVDTSNVVGSNLYIKSLGDDCFIIETTHSDIKNYTIHGIYVDGATGLALENRGVLLLQDESVATAANTMSNISLTGIVAEDCDGPAVVVSGCKHDHVYIEAISKGCRQALYLNAGDATNAGFVKNSEFVIVGTDTQQEGVTTVSAYGTYDNNKIDALISNPADNYSGIIMKGGNWSGDIKIDYDPNGTKVSPLYGVVINDDYNDLNISSKGADTNLLLQGTAQNNNITIGHLKDAITTDLTVSGGSINNSFTKGHIEGAIVNAGGVTNKFNGVIGATGYGSSSISPDANGNGTIAHGINGTPTHIVVGIRGDNVNGVDVESVDGTNITVRIKDAAGADVTAGSFTIDWEAKL